MSRKNKYISDIIIILVTAAVIAAGAYIYLCGKDYSLNQKRKSYLIGASYMTMNNEFYKILSEEIISKVEAEGDRMVLRDPALNAERQIEQIYEMLDMGVDMLIITPVNWESLTEALQKARGQGVYIVVLDTNVQDEELVDCTITSDNYQAGVLVGEYFLSRHDEAEIIIMTHETAKSGLDRVQGFVDTISENDNIKVVQEIECEGQLEIAMPKLRQAIETGIEFDSVFCLNDLASVGAAAALDEKNLLEKVELYGVDASPDSKALIAEGLMTASAAQFPTEIGKEASEVIYKLLSGEQVEKNILVPVKLITQENVLQFGVDRWQ